MLDWLILIAIIIINAVLLSWMIYRAILAAGRKVNQEREERNNHTGP